MAVPGVEITEEADRQIMVFAIRDRIPREMLDAAHEAFVAGIRRCTRAVIVDLSNAQHISSSGAGLLAYYFKLLGTHGVLLSAVSGPAEVMRYMESTGVTRLVRFYSSLGEAVKATGLPRGVEEPELT
jgi:anti-anti-sigma factor